MKTKINLELTELKKKIINKNAKARWVLSNINLKNKIT
jgi:hypothetical protein